MLDGKEDIIGQDDGYHENQDADTKTDFSHTFPLPFVKSLPSKIHFNSC